MYYGAQNDVWSLGIFLAKILHIPHPYIDFNIDTESNAKKKIVQGIPDFHFEPHHMGPGRAASLIIQMLDPDADERITVSLTSYNPAYSVDTRDTRACFPCPQPTRSRSNPHTII
jgi:serine/threonine protein kinase